MKSALGTIDLVRLIRLAMVRALIPAAVDTLLLDCQWLFAAESCVLEHLDPTSFLGLLLQEAVESIPV